MSSEGPSAAQQKAGPSSTPGSSRDRDQHRATDCPPGVGNHRHSGGLPRSLCQYRIDRDRHIPGRPPMDRDRSDPGRPPMDRDRHNPVGPPMDWSRHGPGGPPMGWSRHDAVGPPMDWSRHGPGRPPMQVDGGKRPKGRPPKRKHFVHPPKRGSYSTLGPGNFQQWDVEHRNPGAFMETFARMQSGGMVFTSDAMWNEPGSFASPGAPNWQPPPAPFYRREKEAPPPGKSATKSKPPQVAPPSGMKTRSKTERRAASRLRAKERAKANNAPTPKKATPSKQPKKTTAAKAAAGKVTKKAKKPPVKSAAQVAEEIRLSAMKNTANKIKSLLKKAKSAAAATSASSWQDAPERESAAGPSGPRPRVPGNLMGELEFSSKDWQAIGSGGLGSTDTKDLVPEGDSEDDDTVEIIEPEVEQPEVISIAGEDDSDDWEDVEGGGRIDEDYTSEAQAEIDPLGGVGLDSSLHLDTDKSDGQSRKAVANAGTVVETERPEIVTSAVNETTPLSSEFAFDLGDPVITLEVVNATDAVAAAAAVASVASAFPAEDRPGAAIDSRELDEFDAADITVTNRSAGTDSVAGTAYSPSFVLTLEEESAGSTPASPLPTQLPRLEESPTRGSAGGSEPSGTAPAASRLSPTQEARSSPRLRIKRRRGMTHTRVQSQRASPLVFQPDPESESRDRSEMQPVVRIKREPGLDDDARVAGLAVSESPVDSPVSSPAAPPTAPTAAPRAASPVAPRAASPVAPRVASPVVPRAASPVAPRAASPPAPPTASPAASQAAPRSAPPAVPPTARPAKLPYRRTRNPSLSRVPGSSAIPPPKKSRSVPTAKPPTVRPGILPLMSTSPWRFEPPAVPQTQPSNKPPAARTAALPACPPARPPLGRSVVPDEDAPVVFIPPDAAPPSGSLSSPAGGRKRRVSDTQTSPVDAWRLPMPAKRVRSTSECSALAEPISKPSPPPQPPPPAAAGSLVRRLMKMGKESLRTVVDDPSLLRSRHMMTELMRAHRGQQARRMELERFAAGGAGGGKGSPARKESDEDLPVEVLSDIQQILDTSEGEKNSQLLSSPLPRGLLSANRLGDESNVDELVRESTTGLGHTAHGTSISRGRVAKSVAAAFARRTSQNQREAAAAAAPSAPRREESPSKLRPSGPASAVPNTAVSRYTVPTQSKVAASVQSKVSASTQSRATITIADTCRPAPGATSDADVVDMATETRSAAGSGDATGELT